MPASSQTSSSAGEPASSAAASRSSASSAPESFRPGRRDDQHAGARPVARSPGRVGAADVLAGADERAEQDRPAARQRRAGSRPARAVPGSTFGQRRVGRLEDHRVDPLVAGRPRSSAVTPPIETPKSAICSGAFVVSSQSTNASTVARLAHALRGRGGLALPVVAEDRTRRRLYWSWRIAARSSIVALVAAPAMDEDHRRTRRTGSGCRGMYQPASLVPSADVRSSPAGAPWRRAVRRVCLRLQGRIGARSGS